ncbi:Qat anti-phage system TatD family nuclease QatD [Nocardioides sp.]|uniref:Qat anti-phage system TatD family nuclease QatD n=1 Tax=Nocardioides sp. TaxID=35761 RepID=UPI0026226273|nr:Qat anti-phage system TatD family nuclease QatD [Nocardioides sp.]MDI6911237.1 TatD family hydrolase [Nocardioides sp.]
MTVDLHCHLDLYRNAVEVVAEVQRRGIAVLSVTTTPTAFRGTSRLAQGCPQVKTALGLHPELAGQREHELGLFDQLVAETRFVGEVGLDGSRRFAASRETQRRVFDHILRSCADAGGRVLSIHSRSAVAAVLDSLEAAPEAGIPVLHWFTGTARQAEAAVEAGCWFSVGPGMLQTPKSREILRLLPRTRILTETDGPFASTDGAPAYPWHVEHAIAALAELWDVSVSDTAAQLETNFADLIAASGP